MPPRAAELANLVAFDLEAIHAMKGHAPANFRSVAAATFAEFQAALRDGDQQLAKGI